MFYLTYPFQHKLYDGSDTPVTGMLRPEGPWSPIGGSHYFSQDEYSYLTSFQPCKLSSKGPPSRIIVSVGVKTFSVTKEEEEREGLDTQVPKGREGHLKDPVLLQYGGLGR